MFKFGKSSEKRLMDIHPDLVKVIRRAMSMQIMDFSIIEGVRSEERQEKLFRTGATRTMKSKHLIQEDGYAHAVDLYPYPINMELVNKGDPREIARFGVLAGIMRTCSILEGVEIISGMDWDGDGETLDHTFFDGPHFQIRLT